MVSAFTLETSSGFATWLSEQNCSLIVSGYQSGQVFVVGTDSGGKARLAATRFDRAMGLSYGPRGLWIATLSQLSHFVPVRAPPKKTAEHDIFFVPQCSLHTGYINAHEMAVDDTGRPLVAASFFNCVLAVDVMRGATPVWSPSPIKELKAADVCHVNGICIDRGRLRFASALAAVGQVGGWREQHDGGVIFDCLAGKTVATSLSRPHSPRLYDGRLWVLNSGNGTIGFIRSGKLTEMTMCPGYPRGLTFLGNSAVIGVSRLRESGSGTNLPLAGRLQQKKITSRCGVVILDIGTGKPLHEAYFGEGVDEIFDVVVLQGVKNPKLVKPGSQEAARSYLFRKGASAARVRPAARIVKQAKGEF